MASLLCRLSSSTAHAGALSRPQGRCDTLSARQAVPPRLCHRVCTRQLTQCTAAAQELTAVQAVPAASRNQQAKEARAHFEEDTDVLITCSDGENVHAHATILRITSPFWSKLIPSGVEPDDPAELEDEHASSELMEVMLCRLYPIYPQSEINGHNVVALGRLAHKRDVACVLRACEAFLLDKVAGDCHDCKGCGDCIKEIELAVNCLQLSKETGMDALAKSCDKRLRDVNGLGKQLMNDDCLNALSATTLKTLVKMLVSGNK